MNAYQRDGGELVASYYFLTGQFCYPAQEDLVLVPFATNSSITSRDL
jgi:hypothetical protein